MKSNLFKIFFISAVIVYSFNCMSFQDTVVKRVSPKDGFDEDKLTIRSQQDKGISCLLKKSLKKAENFYSISTEYIVTGYDMFPFKLELGKIWVDYIKLVLESQEKDKNLNDTSEMKHMVNKDDIKLYMLSIQLIYLNSSDEKKKYIDEILEDNKEYDHYLKYKFTTQQVELARSYNSDLNLGIETWSEDENMIYNNLGFGNKYRDDAAKAFQFFESFMNNNNLLNQAYGDILNEDSFLYFYSVLKKGFPIELHSYIRMTGMNLDNAPGKVKNKLLIKDLTNGNLNFYFRKVRFIHAYTIYEFV